MSVAVTMTTGQLVVLLSSGEVVTVGTQRGARMQHVVTLADFAVHYHLPDPRETDLQLFVIHTYYGIFCKGELRYMQVTWYM